MRCVVNRRYPTPMAHPSNIYVCDQLRLGRVPRHLRPSHRRPSQIGLLKPTRRTDRVWNRERDLFELSYSEDTPLGRSHVRSTANTCLAGTTEAIDQTSPRTTHTDRSGLCHEYLPIHICENMAGSTTTIMPWTVCTPDGKQVPWPKSTCNRAA